MSPESRAEPSRAVAAAQGVPAAHASPENAARGRLFPGHASARDEPSVPERSASDQAQRALSDLLAEPDPPEPQRRWPEAQLGSAGLRRIESRHVTLYTDVASDAEVDRLPAIFDEAIPMWAAHFDVPPEKTRSWRLNAFLIRDQEPFAALDMLPAREIKNGFATKDNLWIHEQSTPYYRRHLWLHEGTHAFMHAMLGRTSPGWFMEGMAELLGTHRIGDGRLEMGVMPRAAAEVPALGRIELVQQDVDAGRVHAIEDIMRLDNRRALPSEAYAWCWALARFLDTHPRYRDAWRNLSRTREDAEFDARFRAAFADEWHELQTEWAVFATTLSYNHEIEPTVLDFAPGARRVSAGESLTAEIRADRGWQNAGIVLEAGQTYRITAHGRYQIDDEPQTWWCEPGGVTIHYHRGKPLGILLAALLTRTAEGQPQAASFIRPLAVGPERIVTPEATGTLYLRINDSPGALGDNRGEVSALVGRE